MRRKAACGCLVCAVISLPAIFVVPNASADRAQSESRENTTPPPPQAAIVDPTNHDPLQTELLDEISEIRQRVGLNLYQGTLLDETRRSSHLADDGFREALRQVAPLPPPGNALKPVKSYLDCEARYARDVYGRLSAEDLQLVNILRQASQQLDMRAGDLEIDRQFVGADRLRRLAQGLRREARRVEGATE